MTRLVEDFSLDPLLLSREKSHYIATVLMRLEDFVFRFPQDLKKETFTVGLGWFVCVGLLQRKKNYPKSRCWMCPVS